MDSGEAKSVFIDGRQFVLLLAAGVVGLVAFELLANTVGPIVDHVMRPGNLVTKLFRNVLGLSVPLPVGDAIHVATTVIFYPLGFLLFRRVAPALSTLVAGIAWGVVLWLFAQSLVTPLAGRPFMANFTFFLWVSLAVHVLYSMAVAHSYDILTRRHGRSV